MIQTRKTFDSRRWAKEGREVTGAAVKCAIENQPQDRYDRVWTPSTQCGTCHNTQAVTRTTLVRHKHVILITVISHKHVLKLQSYSTKRYSKWSYRILPIKGPGRLWNWRITMIILPPNKRPPPLLLFLWEPSLDKKCEVPPFHLVMQCLLKRSTDVARIHGYVKKLWKKLHKKRLFFIRKSFSYDSKGLSFQCLWS